ALFTNLSPEHIEAHGSYDKYRAHKGKLFEGLSHGRDKGVKKTAVINLDDNEAGYFLSFNENNIGFTLTDAFKKEAKKIISVKNISIGENGAKFTIGNVEFRTKLLGKFNVYNLVSAITVCNALDVPVDKIKDAIARIESVPGRMEFIKAGQDFEIIVDYAHEPASMKALYGIVREIPHKRVIHIFGATGGGRDKSRRKILGEIADQNAQIIILTNDDPYSEDEKGIIEDIKDGIKKKQADESFFIELDRQKAIEKGIGLAREGDVVLITGKGCEQKMALAGGMVPWDDRTIARKAINTKKLMKLKS
ncbi:Mur ligase family protein, partial [Patescibacteria group bacterium]